MLDMYSLHSYICTIRSITSYNYIIKIIYKNKLFFTFFLRNFFIIFADFSNLRYSSYIFCNLFILIALLINACNNFKFFFHHQNDCIIIY